MPLHISPFFPCPLSQGSIDIYLEKHLTHLTKKDIFNIHCGALFFMQKSPISFKSIEEQGLISSVYVYMHYHSLTVNSVESEAYLDQAFADIFSRLPRKSNLTLLETGAVICDAIDIIGDLLESEDVASFWPIICDYLKPLDPSFLPTVQKNVLLQWQKFLARVHSKEAPTDTLRDMLNTLHAESDPDYFLQILQCVAFAWSVDFKTGLPQTAKYQLAATYQHFTLAHLMAESARVLRIVGKRRYTYKPPQAPKLTVTENKNPPLYHHDDDDWEEI